MDGPETAAGSDAPLDGPGGRPLALAHVDAPAPLDRCYVVYDTLGLLPPGSEGTKCEPGAES